MTAAPNRTIAMPILTGPAAARAARSIPPLWPLAATVAVNPFLGQAGESLATAAARLARVAGISVTLPRAWFAARIAAGDIGDDDLAAALAASPAYPPPGSLADLKAAASAHRPPPSALPTVADLAAAASGIDWPGLVAERIGLWAGGYFDDGQALWAAPRGNGAYAAWRSFASHDLAPEIAGLRGFGTFVARRPTAADLAIAETVQQLGLPEAGLDVYFHRLLMGLGGWAQLARTRLWEAELAGGSDDTLTDLLAVRLAFEAALLAQYAPAIASGWQEATLDYAAPVAPRRDDILDSILQEASERAAQRRLATVLAMPPAQPGRGRAALQAAFCIDVRSEVLRRALEAVDPGIETLGFAGFFGLRVAHRRFGSDVEELRLPVLLAPTLLSCSGDDSPATTERRTASRIAARAKRAWGRFKLAAVSSFAFVEAAGPTYVGKLLRDGMGLVRSTAPNDPAPRIVPALDLGTRLATAAAVLKAMSLTGGFARVVVIAGHGASVVNNPHASALNCGACGGYSGEVNARLLAALLNDPAVREGLAGRGIAIPADTLFLAALHDTTTDAVTLYDGDHAAPDHAADIAQARRWLAAAGAVARCERAFRLPRAGNAARIPRRARDWAEIRPEWALAGCESFIAAPRHRTAGRNLAGRAFLHDYDWRRDEGFGILELIMTAPVVVASWISLQYYGSIVAPGAFGAGNKLLHNVVGGVGVVEGNGGLLRAGLPWQSVHDGERLIHDPIRLSVLIEAPRDAIARVLEQHDRVRALFDNRWLHLFALDGCGRMAWRYAGNLAWDPMTADSRSEQSKETVPA
jgi:uncharacterized protein YbcC (UPF0753/DUF2309 family)